MQYLVIIGSTACVYIFILVTLRLFGKKELAQLSLPDFVFIMLISNAVQNAMMGSDTSLFGGLCATGTLFAINAGLRLITYRFPKLSGFVQGHAIMLIYDGKVIQENLRKVKISADELKEAVREHGVSSIGEVNLAVLEVDGNISVLSNDYQVHSTQTKRHKNEHQIKE